MSQLDLLPDPNDQNSAPRTGNENLYLIAALLSAGLIFVTDLDVPLGIAFGSLYIISVLCTIPLESRRITYGMAAWCAVLTLLSQWIAPDVGVDTLTYCANLGISIICIFISAVLGSIVHQKKQQVTKISKLLTICAWTKKIKVGEKWLSMEEYLSTQLGLHLTHGISEEAARKLKTEMGLEVDQPKSSAREVSAKSAKH